MTSPEITDAMVAAAEAVFYKTQGDMRAALSAALAAEAEPGSSFWGAPEHERGRMLSRIRELETALTAPSASQEALREALDLDKAVSTAALTWCGEKDRETFQSDVDYFKHNWRALPGLTAYVDRVLTAARAALAQSAAPVQPSRRDFWLQYDHQVGRWCVENKPPKVIRTGAEVIHTREVVASPSSKDVLREALIQSWIDFLDANPDDLTSPEDLPDHALMTCEQFIAYSLAALAQSAPPARQDRALREAAQALADQWIHYRERTTLNQQDAYWTLAKGQWGKWDALLAALAQSATPVQQAAPSGEPKGMWPDWGDSPHGFDGPQGAE